MKRLKNNLQAVLDPVVRNIVLKEDNDVNLLSQEAMYSALVGALTAGIMNIPSAHVRFQVTN